MNVITTPTRYFTLLFFAVLLPLSGLAQSDSNTQTLVDQLTKQMALEHQLGEEPGEIRAQFVQNPLQLPDDKNKRMLELFDEAYTQTSLLNDFKTALRQEMSGQDRNEISQWLNNESVQSVTQAQQEFYTLQGKRKRIITRYEMDQDSPKDQRKQLIATLTDNSSAAESSVESSVIILRSVIRALSELSEQRNFSEPQIDAIANNFRSQIQGQAAQLANEQLLVMYHNIKTDALQNYIDFWQTDAGQWLDQAISRSRQAAYEAAADRFLESVQAAQ